VVAHAAAGGVSYVRHRQLFHDRCLAERVRRHRGRSRIVLALWLAISLGVAAQAWWTGTTPLVGAAIAVPGCYAAWLEATETRAAAAPRRISL
jgi:hypothetical protein